MKVNRSVFGVWLFSLAAAIAFAAEPVPSPTAAEFIASVERAHGRDAFDTKQALAFDFENAWGGKTMLRGRFILTRDMGRIRAELDNGTTVVWDGTDAWVTPAGSELKGARFHILTWPYFLLTPMKLGDPGSHLALQKRTVLGGKPRDAAKLTFDKGVGDAPEDWYIAYRDPQNSLLTAMAYIVTYSKTAAEAEKEPHAITYEDFVTVEGVTFSTRWQFWNWSEEKGIHGDAIGEGKVSGLRFVTPEANAFVKPDGARRDEKPQKH